MASSRCVVVEDFRIPDALWERLEPLLPRVRRSRQGGRPPLPQRQVRGTWYRSICRSECRIRRRRDDSQYRDRFPGYANGEYRSGETAGDAKQSGVRSLPLAQHWPDLMKAPSMERRFRNYMTRWGITWSTGSQVSVSWGGRGDLRQRLLQQFSGLHDLWERGKVNQSMLHKLCYKLLDLCQR